jgi:iron complex outermembrane receptor protein
MKTFLRAGVALLALALLPTTAAYAQSTGSREVEADVAPGDEIVVTGTKRNDIGGVTVPDSPKARSVITSQLIQSQRAGQTILDTINLVPGVSFQNNDPYGSAGGTLSIRGFDSSRVSLTFDGVPLNDSGNYAIYSNQQIDPELIDQVNVNLGTTDVDSPTASAAGGTVNYTTRLPSREPGARIVASAGEYAYTRFFTVLDTGDLTPSGTRAFVSASTARNDNVFNDYGRIRKQQYNAKLYQPLGDGGDFIAIAGHYNENRPNFFGSVPLRTDTFGGRTAGPASSQRFPLTKDERFYSVPVCNVAAARPGLADTANLCGSTFDERLNPSNTGNVRGSSRFTLARGLLLTVDPSVQFVRANGGGTVVGTERALANGTTGYGSAPNAGRDLNGDGDLLDTVRLLAPSNTRTRRYGVTASLIWDLNPDQRFRVAYTLDNARHRQTGDVGTIDVGGRPDDPFGGLGDPVLDRNGETLQKRDRLSYAILNQVAGEYRGRFIDGRMTVSLGLRAPFFTRKLQQNCFETSASGGVFCSSDADATVQALNPTYRAPRSQRYEYDELLPNGGLTFDLTDRISAFGSYAKGLSVPSTDNLYNSLFFAVPTKPKAETTDTFDAGLRYKSSIVQAQIAGWHTNFKNRTASAYDVELNESVFRNLGTVEKYGVDGSIGVQPIRQLTLYAFGSYLKSKIEDDVQTAANAFAPTGGKRESGAPKYTFGGRAEVRVGDFQLGAQAKRTGERYVYDTNLPVYAVQNGAATEVFGATTPAYTLVDLDAKFSLAGYGLANTYLQVNATNLFDVRYVGGIGGGLNQTITRNPAGAVTAYGSPYFVQIDAPRAVSFTISVGM